MSDSAEILFMLLLLCMAVNQCGTCNHTRDIAEALERAQQQADAGVKP